MVWRDSNIGGRTDLVLLEGSLYRVIYTQEILKITIPPYAVVVGEFIHIYATCVQFF